MLQVTGAFNVPLRPLYTRRFPLAQYGGVGDGKTSNTQAFKRAFAAASAGGGGTVSVSDGHFLTGPIELRSRTYLSIEPDAMLLGATECAEYAGHPPYIVSCHDANETGVVGGGVIDGRAFPNLAQRYNLTIGRPNPSAAPVGCRASLVNFDHCSRVLVRDVTLQNSGDWTSHYAACTNVLLDNVTVLGDPRRLNSNGVDPHSTLNMTINNSWIDVADNGMFTKSRSTNSSGLRDLLVANTVAHSRSSAFKIGNETRISMEGIRFVNFTLLDSSRGLDIQHRHDEALRIPRLLAGPCLRCFNFSVAWKSGGVHSTLPMANFSVRKVEYLHYPPDGRTYAYADVVGFDNPYYPVSYSSEVGAFSSADGFTDWRYHGIVLTRGPAGAWDGGGVASPGAAIAGDGATVLLGYTAERSSDGGKNRGIGVASAPHPLGPFRKRQDPVASPQGLCGGSGRCDDVIMQARPGGTVHLYHSVKGSDVVPGGDSIYHTATTDAGQNWSASTMVLQRRRGPEPAGLMETIAGKFFPSLGGGRGAMVLVTDGGNGDSLTSFISTHMDGGFEPAIPAELAAHPPLHDHPKGTLPPPGDWAAGSQVAFVPDAAGHVVSVSYSLWTNETVAGRAHGYTHMLYHLQLT